MSKFITAKELAAELEINERTFRQPRKIRELGLAPAIDSLYHKPIRFYKDEARRILTAQGIKVAF